MNPGETCLPAYSGEVVIRKTLVLLLVLGFSCARVVSRASEGMREPGSTTVLAKTLTQVVVYVCVNSISVACDDVERLCIIDVAVKTGNCPTRRPLASPRGAEGYLTL